MSGAKKIASNTQEVFYDKGQKTILVVEDDRTHRAIMDKILQECLFSTVLAENGYEALEKLDSGQKFDLIMMDWDMPGLDGLQTVKEIRIRQANGKIPYAPVVAFTSNRKPGDREKCIAAGMDAYLPKDVWTSRWRQSLIDNLLQGLVLGDFNAKEFNVAHPAAPKPIKMAFDLDAFDRAALDYTASFLKDELEIAVEEYLEDAAAYIRAIKEGLEYGDAEKVARGSHPLKSNSLGFGLTAVSEIAESINTMARKVMAGESSLNAIDFLFPQLQKAFHKAEKKLSEAIKRSDS